MRELSEGETLDRAAQKIAMSENTARRYRDGAKAKSAKAPRTYRTRADPFEGVGGSGEDARVGAGLGGEDDFRSPVRVAGQLVMFSQQHSPGEYAC
jgi:hypothetical protein